VRAKNIVHSSEKSTDEFRLMSMLELNVLGGEGGTVDLKLSVDQATLGATVIAVSGEIDVYTAPKLREKLSSLIEGGTYRLILDLEGVEFLDSTGLGALIGGLKGVRAHDGSIDIVCTQSRILRIFKITRLDKVFDIYDTISDALRAFSKGAD
jgi:anti-sigma B factor antagonist